MGLIRILAIIFLVYVGFRIIGRFLLPWLAKYFVQKASSSMEEQIKQRQEGKKIFEDGEVVIRKTPKSKSNPNADSDEYVDFEEVE